MKTARRKRKSRSRRSNGLIYIFICLIAAIVLAAVIFALSLPRLNSDNDDRLLGTYDELNTVVYAGMRVKVDPEAAVSTYKSEDFHVVDDNFIYYDGTGGNSDSTDTESDDTSIDFDGTSTNYDDTETSYGVDVSSHQEDIDWQAVADEGMDFAFIRVGYRGITEGELHADDYFTQNIEGAKAAGLDVGVYMFSQAVTVEEALEEADFTLELIKGYDLDYPVIFDWEDSSRNKSIDKETLTACALAFCNTIENAGYSAGVYFNTYIGYFLYDFRSIEGFTMWLAQYQDSPDFYYDFQIWQYTETGHVNGIKGDTDLDICFKNMHGPKLDE